MSSTMWSFSSYHVKCFTEWRQRFRTIILQNKQSQETFIGNKNYKSGVFYILLICHSSHTCQKEKNHDNASFLNWKGEVYSSFSLTYALHVVSSYAATSSSLCHLKINCSFVSKTIHHRIFWAFDFRYKHRKAHQKHPLLWKKNHCRPVN